MVARTLNQTGDKWSHLPDLSDWLLLSENKVILATLHVTSVFLVWFSSLLWDPTHFLGLLLGLFSVIGVVFHNLAKGSLEIPHFNYNGSEK